MLFLHLHWHCDDGSLTPRFDACRSLASWHRFCFCVSSHFSGISHSLLNCHLQPLLGQITAFCYQHFCTSPSWLSPEKHFPEMPALNGPLNPSFGTRCAKIPQENWTVRRFLCTTLACPILWCLSSFLSKLPVNLFCLVLYSDCECFGTYFLNLARSKSRDSWSLVRIHRLCTNTE